MMTYRLCVHDQSLTDVTTYCNLSQKIKKARNPRPTTTLSEHEWLLNHLHHSPLSETIRA